MSQLIIITCKVTESFINSIKGFGYEVMVDENMSYDQLAKAIVSAEGLVVSTRIPIDKHMLDLSLSLKWIGRLGSGMEMIDTTYAATKGIKCFSSPEGNRNAVAEHMLGLLLDLNKRITHSYNEIRRNQWNREKNRGTEISGKCIGIIGFGNTGSAFARILSGFDVTILAFDKYKSGFGNEYIKESMLAEIGEKADVISIHLPLNHETFHFANDDLFNSLKQNPIFLTACRGKITNTEALIRALKNNKIRGAALDVLENEKLGTYNKEEQAQLDWLLTQENVLITPHIAGYSFEALEKMSDVLLSKLGMD